MARCHWAYGEIITKLYITNLGHDVNFVVMDTLQR